MIANHPPTNLSVIPNRVAAVLGLTVATEQD